MTMVYRLVSKARKRQGLVRTASTTDPIVIAAAAVQKGLLADEGIVRLLPDRIKCRAAKLLGANEVMEVQPKASTLRGDHRTSQVRKQLGIALPTVIGPLYMEAMTLAGVSLTLALQRQRIVRWLKASIEDESGELNKRLTRGGYGDLCGLKRSQQWWERVFEA